MTSQTTQTFIVRKLDQHALSAVGPWVVQAKSPRGAVRIVRNRWPHWLTNHVSCETHVLGVQVDGRPDAFVSDRRGKVLLRDRGLRSAYAA